MTAFAAKVSALTGVSEDRLERLSGGDLCEVLLLRRPDGRCTVAKGGAAVSIEATMLRMLSGSGVPVPIVEGEHDQVLLLEHIPNDGVFSPASWRNIGAAMKRLHARRGERFGWPANYRLGTVELDNRETQDWVSFWGEQRLIGTARLLDRPWRERIEKLAGALHQIIPASPPPSLLHGDLWQGNILVQDGELAALIDPACYFGHSEVDLAMLSLFEMPLPEFWEAYGHLEPGWERRRPVYQLFPALVHFRLFGQAYAGMVDRLLSDLGH